MVAVPRATAGLSEYEIRHLVEHLHAAGSGAAIHRLLRLEDASDAANAWFAAQERIRNVDGYLRDLQLGLDLTGPDALALHARYALMTSSARSVASAVPAALLGVCVAGGLRTVDEALAQLERTSDTALVADALSSLAPHVPAALQAELRRLAAGLPDDRARARAIAGLAEGLAETELPALLADVERLAPDLADDVSAALSALANRLGKPYALRLLALARGIERGVTRAEALLALAPLADEHDRPRVVEEALDAVRSDVNHFRRTEVLAEVLAALPQDRREHVRAPLVREAIANVEYAGNVVHLARKLLRDDELMLVVRRAIALDRWDEGPKALLALAPGVPDAELGELLELTRAGTGPDARATQGTGIIATHDRTVARMVAAVADRLPRALHEHALGIVAELDPSLDRCVALAALGEPERAAAEATAVTYPDDRAEALFALGDATLDAAMLAVAEVDDPAVRAELLLASGRAELVPQALTAARAAKESWQRVELLLKAIVAADDREPLVHETLGLIADRATERSDPPPAAQLAALGPYLPPSLAREAAAIALETAAHQWSKVPEVAVALAPHLPEHGLRVLVDDCGRLQAARRAELLKRIADSVPPSLHANVLTQVAELNGEDILPVVDAYAERLAPSLLGEALRVCRRIGDAGAAVSTATDLVVAAGVRPVPESVLEGALATGDLDRLVPLMSDDQIARALAAIEAMAPDPGERATVLGALAAVMPPERLGELVERAGGDERALARVVRRGAARFPPELVDRVADSVVALAHAVDRFNAVVALAPRLAPETRDRLRRRTDDVDLLLALVPGADPVTREELIDAACAAVEQLDSDAATAAAYLEISRLLDGEKRATVLDTALSWAYVVELAEAREPILAEVLSELASVDPARALRESSALPDRAQHRLLPQLISGLDAAGQLAVAAQVDAVANENTRADLLAALLAAEGLAAPITARLREAVQRLAEPKARVTALAALVPALPGEAGTELRALAETRELPVPSRELALGSLLALGSDDQRVAAFAGLLATRRSSTSSGPLDVGVTLNGAAEPALMWMKLMRVLAGEPRPTILDALSALADVAAGYGDEPIAQLVEAVGDSVRWWP